jgi:hypothetical protein
MKLYKWMARLLAKVHKLDFEHRCCFRHQLKYPGLVDGSGEIVLVKMKSGRMARYKVTSEQLEPFNNTGQKNWKFEFQGYNEKNT